MIWKGMRSLARAGRLKEVTTLSAHQTNAHHQFLFIYFFHFLFSFF